MQTTRSKTHEAWLCYAAIWSIGDAQERLSNLAKYVNSNCLYTDPNVQLRGNDDLCAYMEQCLDKIPGLRFETTQFEEHHNRSLAHWNMVDGAGNLLCIGASFVLYIEGQLSEMTGFFDQLQN